VSVTVVIAGGPGLRLGEAELPAVIERAIIDPVHPWWLRRTQHGIGADPADQLDRQVAQAPGQAGDVVPGIADDDAGRVPGPPSNRCDEPFDHS
jgi:hypothetical protein